MDNHMNSANDMDTSWSENSEIFLDESLERDDEKKKSLFVILVKSFSMMILALAVLIFVGIAWFTMNRDAETTGMGVKVVEMPFELAVTGNNVGALGSLQSGTGEEAEYTSYELYNKAENGSNAKALTNGTYQSGTYVTDGQNVAIKWRLTDPTSNTGLGPDSQGSYTFNVIPKRTGPLEVKFSIRLEGYTAIQDKNEDGSFDVTSISTIGSSGTVEEQNAEQFLNGHILFFSGKVNVEEDPSEPAIYSYTGFLDKNEFKLSDFNNGVIYNATEGVPIPVTIHWIWPNTFGQMVFSASENEGLVPVGGDRETIERICSYIVDDPTVIFCDIDESDALDMMVDGDNHFDPAKTKTNQYDLSIGYNQADQKIGTHIDYMLLMLQAE